MLRLKFVLSALKFQVETTKFAKFFFTSTFGATVWLVHVANGFTLSTKTGIVYGRLWSSMVSYGRANSPCTRPALSLRIASGAVDVN